MGHPKALLASVEMKLEMFFRRATAPGVAFSQEKPPSPVQSGSENALILGIMAFHHISLIVRKCCCCTCTQAGNMGDWPKG